MLFILYLGYGNDVRQSKWVIFLLQFKTGHRAMEKTGRINNTFGPATANTHIVQQWFKKFCKGAQSFEEVKRSV